MLLNVLAVGDVVGEGGQVILSRRLPGVSFGVTPWHPQLFRPAAKLSSRPRQPPLVTCANAIRRL